MDIFGPYKKSNRSASMQLSINAIVILVMAMAVLGLGLGIVKGIKAKSDKFLDFNVDISNPASASQHLTEVKDWSFKANTVNQIGVGFYNTKTQCESEGAQVAFDCPNLVMVEGSEVTESDAFSIKQVPTKIGVGEPGTLKFQIIPNKDIIKDSYACTFEVVCGEDATVVEQSPVFITVTA